MGSQAASRITRIPSLQSTAPVVDSNTASEPVFWIYMDDGGHWRLRKEGGVADAAFASRGAALAFVRDLARNTLSYRLFIETEDGRIVQEPHDAPASRGGREVNRTAGVEDHVESPAPENPRAGAEAEAREYLRQRLEWANQVSSAARVRPSRMTILADWLHKMRS